MIFNKTILSILMVTIIFLPLVSIGQDNQVIVESDLQSIDPLRPEAGDFLFEDYRENVRQAERYYQNGDYENAARYYLYSLKSNPDDFTSIYNLACCYGLMEKPALAGKYLKLAVESGFSDLAFINSDPDFSKVKGQAPFMAAIDSINVYMNERYKDAGDILYFDACAIFQCRLKLPENFDKNKTYPLVVALHGYGDAADNFATIWQRFENPEFLFAVPYAPYHFTQGSRIAYSWNLWLPGDDEFPGQDFDITEEYIINLINTLKKYYNISDTYLLGHSQGASSTYITGIKHHEMFKGLIPMSGPLSPFWLNDSTLNEGNQLKIYTVHGINDRTIRYGEALAAKKLLEDHGYNIKFTGFDGGHEYPPEAIMQKIEKWIEGE